MSTHSKILIHVIFSTKQPFKLLDKTWRDDLFGVMGGNAQTQKGVLLHQLNQSFRDEYLEFLRKHPIEFDKRYVFEDEHFG